MTKEEKPRPLRVISLTGGAGRTCGQVLRSALAQFDKPNVELVLRSGVRTVDAVREIVEEAAEAGAVICHSLVEPEIRKAVIEETRKRHVPVVDVLGQVLTLLDDHLEQSPRRQPGLSYQLQREHFDRIDAVDFTLKHDDGAGLKDLDRADVVLVGVSRVCKSVTCFFLGYRGIFAANVPLIAGQDPPQQLLKIDAQRVVGLTMNAARLQSLRETRIQAMGSGPFERYGDRDEIQAELRDARALMSRHGWRTIDVSYKSVEEVSKEVLSMIGR